MRAIFENVHTTLDAKILRAPAAFIFPLRDAPSPIILSKPLLSCVRKEATYNSQTLPFI